MRPPRPASVVLVVTALVVTVVISWATWVVDRHSNERLLNQQVRQTASVLGNQVPVITAQMLDVAQLARESHADPDVFRRFVTAKISKSGPFASLSLWRVDATGRHQVVREGVEPVLPAEPSAQDFFTKVQPGNQMFVTGVIPASPDRLGYAVMTRDDTSGLVVYAERLLPPGRRISLAPTSPFYPLHLAVYLGHRPATDQLLESTHPVPVRGRTQMATVPFGDSALTVVGSSPQRLAGGLSATLPWAVLVLGVVLSLLFGVMVERLSRRRVLAEALARENERLFLQQRDIAGTLQHALLPEVPRIEGLEVAARYVPGVVGTEVGGDWYDVVSTGPGRCFFIVGDVSGRGLRAATTMASLRFAIRAYLAQGDGIDRIVPKLRELLDFDDQHQFATVLIGEVDAGKGRVSVVSAGHFAPLLVTGGRARFLDCPVEPPVGVTWADAPVAATATVGGPATVLVFTDGLVERPGEVIDSGLERLRRAATAGPGDPLDDLTDRLVTELLPGETGDDAVILGVRWMT